MKTLTRPRPHPEMIEGPEAFQRFHEAMKAVLKVPKSALPSPFSKPEVQKRTLRKGEGSAKLV